MIARRQRHQIFCFFMAVNDALLIAIVMAVDAGWWTAGSGQCVMMLLPIN